MFVTVLKHAWDSVRNPKKGASDLMRLQLDRTTLLLAGVLVVILHVFATNFFSAIFPSQVENSVMQSLEVPFVSVLVHGFLLLITVAGVFGIGRMVGGTGDFDATLTLMIWLQFLMLIVNVLQIVISIILPFLGSLAALFSVALFLWLFVNFVLVLHGFKSLMKVLLGTMLSFILFVFIAAFGISLFAISTI